MKLQFINAARAVISNDEGSVMDVCERNPSRHDRALLLEGGAPGAINSLTGLISVGVAADIVDVTPFYMALCILRELGYLQSDAEVRKAQSLYSPAGLVLEDK